MPAASSSAMVVTWPALADQLAGVVDLLGRQFSLASEFYSRGCLAFTPARVRSLIRLRSSSARTPIIRRMARPVGVAVSMLFGERNERSPVTREEKELA